MLMGAIGAIALSGTAQAATLDFASLGFGPLGTNQATLPGAVISSFGNDLFVLGFGSGSICAATNGFCATDMDISFTNPVSNLTFQSFGWDPGDTVLITAYSGVIPVFSTTIASDALVDFSFLGSISSLYFDDSSTGAGMAYGNFSFDTMTTPIPLPASLPLLAAGLGVLGFMRRRKTA
jgi:hypothetical protein